VPAIRIAVKHKKFWNFVADFTRGKKLTSAGNGTLCVDFIVPVDASRLKPSLTSLEESVIETET
jgi:hypothetical protein